MGMCCRESNEHCQAASRDKKIQELQHAKKKLEDEMLEELFHPQLDEHSLRLAGNRDKPVSERLFEDAAKRQQKQKLAPKKANQGEIRNSQLCKDF